MSRSNRKPYATEGYGNKNKRIRKRTAARAVRDAKFEDAPASHAFFKKLYESWAIQDFSIYSPNTPKMRRK